PKLRWMFANCYPNTLDTTVRMSTVDGAPDAFVITGDIPCLWLRDSSAQLAPYLHLVRDDPALRTLFHGLIARQARSILIDPYANAFMQYPSARTNLGWAKDDKTEMKPGVAERKWEIDSLC
ncbi:glycoside hydrolase family 125 protein, partial [Escherichia coli]|nr:glycoside hydrolase family 125 protein [Escherichia coli]